MRLINRNLNWKLHFLEWKTLFCTQFSPQNAGNRILGLWDFKNFLREHAGRARDWRPLVDTVGYFIQICWLLQLLLKPLHIRGSFCEGTYKVSAFLQHGLPQKSQPLMIKFYSTAYSYCITLLSHYNNRSSYIDYLQVQGRVDSAKR